MWDERTEAENLRMLGGELPDLRASAGAVSGRGGIDRSFSAGIVLKNSEFVRQSAPAIMTSGQRYEVTVVMRNTGSASWIHNDEFRLGVVNADGIPVAEDATVWGVHRILLPGETVLPGQEVTFTAVVTVPEVLDPPPLRWRMVHERHEWFGQISPPLSATVAQNRAAFVSQLIPTSVTAGQPYDVAITVRNVGTTVWTAEGRYRLGLVSGGDQAAVQREQSWGISRIDLPAGAVVQPSEVVTFRHALTAPASGTYEVRWRMVQEAVQWFGEASPAVVVTCTPLSIWTTRIESIVAKVDRLLQARIEQALARHQQFQLVTPPAESASLVGESPQRVSPETIARLDALFSRWKNPESPGCVVAYLQDGELVCQRCYGMASIEHGVTLTPSSVFAGGSLAKQFIAFIVLLLADEKKLRLDDPLHVYVPEFPTFGSGITLRHLIHHTSGILDDWGLLQLAGWRENADTLEREPVLAIRQEMRSVTPGESFIYSTTGYTLLELVIQRVTRQSLGAYAEANVFKPLGMSSTRFSYDPAEVMSSRVSAYLSAEGGKYRVAAPKTVPGGGNNLFTTVEDMARWDRNYLDADVGGRIIEQMHERGKLNNGCRIGYAYGLMTGHKGVKTFEHSGTDHGCRSYYVRFVRQRSSILLFTNVDRVDPISLAHEVQRIIGRSIRGPE